jgi:hypothetical protein
MPLRILMLLPAAVLASMTLALAQAMPEPCHVLTEERVFNGENPADHGPGLSAAGGYAIDCEVRPDDSPEARILFSQDGLTLLRIDPVSEGGNLSFFVAVDGNLEPRLRTESLPAGQWSRVTASWDGAVMWARVNGKTYRAGRAGAVTDASAPLRVAASHPISGGGFQGAMRNVLIYDTALTETDLLLLDSGLALPAAASPESGGIEFDDTSGWVASGAELSSGDGTLDAMFAGGSAVLATAAVPVDFMEGGVVTLRMAVEGADRCAFQFATDAGRREVAVPLVDDGAMHSYPITMAEFPEWRGNIEMIAIAFPDAPKRVSLDFIRSGDAPSGPPETTVARLAADPPLVRAERAYTVKAVVRNIGAAGGPVKATLDIPGGSIEGPAEFDLGMLDWRGETTATWQVVSAKSGDTELRVTVSAAGGASATATEPLTVHPARAVTPAEYVPEPQPVPTRRLVGVHYCPLWKEGARSGGWGLIEPYPGREPLLGWYDEHNPEMTDWEVKWALDHGINFFVYCWYRDGVEDTVTPFLGHALHEGLFESRYGDQFKFCLMWENQSRQWGVKSREDLLDTLLPYWMEHYFTRDNYLVIDNKPLLFVYRPERVVEDLGSEEAAREAFDAMRERCREAGFDGMYILGEDRNTRPEPLELMKRLGMDLSFSYCWPIADNPDDATAIRKQREIWETRKALDVLPDLVTVSMGWDSTPWHPSATKWALSPAGFEQACREADAFMDTLPADSLASKIVILDNWNEYGEGHYIFPTRRYGFGYLDAVRAAFSDAPAVHEDVVPQDLGLGPYDSLYEAKKQRDRDAARVITPAKPVDPDLLAWWTFDEEDDTPYAWDWSGNGLGGYLEEARRAPGLHGNALVCDGGTVRIPTSVNLAPHTGLTIVCRIYTDTPDQQDRWFLNRIHSGRLDTGYRFGLSGGRLTWMVPQTTWSHQVQAAEPMPVGRWVSVAAVCDNASVKIYMDGRLVAETERFGAVRENGQPLIIGSYDTRHEAHFEGLIDEVKLYGRALTQE